MSRTDVSILVQGVGEHSSYGISNVVTAPALVNFWTDMFKLQVESRSGKIHFDEPGT